MNPSFTHRLSLLLVMLHLGYQEPAQAASGPKLEVYLDGQTQPEPPSKGEVIAWGSNHFGQPRIPEAARSGVVAVAAGGDYTFALKQDGSVLAWGNELSGQTKVHVVSQSGVIAIAASYGQTFALTEDGRVLSASVQSWGFSGFFAATLPVAARTRVVAIAAGEHHMVALKEDGEVLSWGWGWDSAGSGRALTDVPFAAQSGVVAIATGAYHTVALKEDGSVLAWGNSYYGQTSVPMEAQSGVVAIAAGEHHSVALKQDGRVIAWGDNRFRQTNVPAAAENGVVAIVADGVYTIALKQDDSVIAWGQDNSGRINLAAGEKTGVVAIADRGWNSVALSWPSKQSFGNVAFGQFSERSITLRNGGGVNLSNLTFTLTGHDGPDFSIARVQQPETLSADNSLELKIRFTPRKVGLQTAYLGIHSDDTRFDPFLVRLVGTCDGAGIAVTDPLGPALSAGEKGSVLTWRPSLPHSRGRIHVKSEIVAMAIGRYSMTALKQDGGVIAWGKDNYHQHYVPMEAMHGVVAIAAGYTHTVALKQDGSVVSWGSIPNGQSMVKVPAAAKSGVIAIAAGYHTVALKQDGSVLSWGGGHNTFHQSNVPAAAKSDVVAIAAGHYGLFRTFALKQDGRVVTWGVDHISEINVQREFPSDFIAIAAGLSGLAGLKDNGSVVTGFDVFGGNFRHDDVPEGAKNSIVTIAAGYGHVAALVEATGEFGHRQLGTVRDHPIQVSSTGTHPLTIHNITLEGPGADQFQILGTLPNPMASLSTSPLTLRFAPNRVGLAQATLRISSDDPVTPEYTLLLQGTGISTLTATRPNVADSAFTYAPLRTDPQTGLMLQTITYTNTTKTQIAGLRLILSKVASRVYVHSSSPGPTPLTYEVIYSNPIAPSETISFDLVYFDPLRRRAHSIQPIIKAEALLEPEPDSPPVDGKLVPLRLAQATPQGPRLDWASAPRAVYVVEYSDDGGQVWHSAVHRLRSGGSQMFWIDRGQPETKTKPTGIPNQPGGRTYRIKNL